MVNVNDAPTITGTPSTRLDQDIAYSFIPMASDVDASTTLTFSITNKPSWASFDTSTGALTGTPVRADVGTTSGIVISVSDGELTAALPAFNIEVLSTNTTPVSSDMSIEVLEDDSKTFSPEITDEEADDVLTIIVKSQPTSGELTQNGNALTYTPNANYFGSDSFTYVASDTKEESVLSTVSITVTSVNDLPVANDDTFALAETGTFTYTLDVLANDSDIEDDINATALTIVGAQSTLGTVTIDDGLLSLATNTSVQGEVIVDYLMADSDGARASATATVSFTEQSSAAPTFEPVEDITINATALRTKVTLEPPVATDSQGNRLPASLVTQNVFFAPGKHIVYWQATDSEGLTATATQNLFVKPLVSISKIAQVAEGNEQHFSVYLNGQSPTYPLTIPYTVSGTADGSDHDLVSGDVVIESGLSASVVFTVFNDTDVEGEETIDIAIDSTLNVGANSSTQFSIVESNIAPSITTTVVQDGQTRSLVSIDGGEVMINAMVADQNIADAITVEWTSTLPEGLSTSSDGHFAFSTDNLSIGIYTVTATDNGTPALSTTADIYVEVVDTLAILTDQDSDGDLIPDNVEGYADSDGDGIPDYLDAISSCNIGQEDAMQSSEFLLEGESGVCLRKGISTAQNRTGGFLLFEDELPDDEAAKNVGGLFGFVATGLPQAGDSYAIVLPQTTPVMSNSVYRKFKDGQWINFETTDNDKVYTALGERGACPAPKASEWTEGFMDGAWCVQLQIVDGGPNDDDGKANRTIVDPGGVAVLTSANTFPIANRDEVVIGKDESITIDVLANDTDSDGDALTITAASVDFGHVVIENNQLQYTPLTNFIGEAIINYSIDDGIDGSASGEVTVTVVTNNAPVTQTDEANTTDRDSIDIDVLGNDTDADGDVLTVIGADAQEGQATVNANGTLHYVPQAGFSGVDTITYTIQDSKQAQATGQVNVTVTAYEVITVTNGSSGGSGGSVGGIALFMLALLAVTRRRKLVAGYALLATSIMLSGAANADDMNVQNPWSLNASFGQARVHGNGITNTSEATQLSVDEITGTWSVGGFYQFQPNWQVGLRYIDLGEGELTIKGDTTNPAALHQQYASEAPTFATGVSLEVNYLSAITDNIEAKVLAGIFRHETEIDSVVEGRTTITQTQKETKPYAGAAIAYNVTDNADVFLQYSHYVMSDDDINEVSVGLSVSF